MAAAFTALIQGNQLSLAGFRRGPICLWLAVLGLLAFALGYLAPVGIALRQPRLVEPLPRLDFPFLAFPSLSAEKGDVPTASPPVAAELPAPAPQRQARRPSPASAPAGTGRPVRVPVITSTYSLEPPPAKDTAQQDPFAGVPVVEDTVGAAPPMAGVEHVVTAAGSTLRPIRRRYDRQPLASSARLVTVFQLRVVAATASRFSK